jgi:hypothetical protein
MINCQQACTDMVENYAKTGEIFFLKIIIKKIFQLK